MICPLLSIILFDTRNFSENRRVPLQRLSFRSCWTKKIRQNRDAPPPMHENFRQKKFSETPKCSPMKYFGTVRQKLSDGQTWHLLLRNKFFDTSNFLKHWRDAHESFRHCETWNFRRKTWYPPSSSLKLFQTRNFLKNSRIPWRIFSALWYLKLSTENRDMPRLIHKFFSIPDIFLKTEGFFYKDCRFVPVGQKIWTKSWCPTPHMHDNFQKNNFSETPKCSPMKSFGEVRQKFFDGKLW